MSSFSASIDTSTSMNNNNDNNNCMLSYGGGGGGLSDQRVERMRYGGGAPKFKSSPPPSLPISPPCLFSPSSYFNSLPPGLSPSELLDSPVLLPSSNLLPSPTTGTFSAPGFNWQTSSRSNNQPFIKQEDNRNYSDFSFRSSDSILSGDQTYTGPQQQQQQFQLQPQAWNFTEMGNQEQKMEFAPLESCYSPEIATLQTNSHAAANNGSYQSTFNNNYQQPPTLSVREQKRSEDGYNWRKYGQKQVKGSENPRSYYKCTFANCPTKKKVERSYDGQITEIVYKGSHNHPKPQSTKRQSSNASQLVQAPSHNTSEGITQMDSVTTPENSSITMGGDDFDQTSEHNSRSGDDFDEDDQPEIKRWKKECENEIISAGSNRTVREPRVVVQTRSDIDILVDGYRWRKYGQKVVKGNHNPRSYYKCTYPKCQVRKLVERASDDSRDVITTYEGKHNHDVPAERGSGGHSANRMLPLPVNNTNTTAGTTIRSVPMMNHSSNHNNSSDPTSESQPPFTLEMLQSPGNFRFSGFGNATLAGSYANQQQSQQTDYGFSRTKGEPRDDLCLESFLR